MATAANNYRQEQINAELARTAALTPFAAPDQTLAESVNALKDADIERSRATTEEARAQHDAVIQREAVRRQEQQQQQAVQAESYRTSAMQRDAHDAIALGLRLAKAQASLPPNADAWDASVNPDVVRVISNSAQEGSRITGRYAGTPDEAEFSAMLQEELARQTGQSSAPQAQQPQAQPSRPETFPDGSTVQLKDNKDGTWEMQLITGEIFKGDAQTIMRKAGEAQVNTKTWGRQQRAAAQQAAAQQSQNQPSSREASPSNLTFDAEGNVQSVDLTKIDDVSRWQLDQMAATLGYRDGAEMVHDQIETRQRLKQWEEERFQMDAASSFLNAAPDFPNDQESIDKLFEVMSRSGWEVNPQNMLAAHSLAIRNHLYQPLSQEAQRAAHGEPVQYSRPTAPPMVPTGSPDAGQQGFNVWDSKSVPLDQLRSMAIRQELERR